MWPDHHKGASMGEASKFWKHQDTEICRGVYYNINKWLCVFELHFAYGNILHHLWNFQGVIING